MLAVGEILIHGTRDRLGSPRAVLGDHAKVRIIITVPPGGMKGAPLLGIEY